MPCFFAYRLDHQATFRRSFWKMRNNIKHINGIDDIMMIIEERKRLNSVGGPLRGIKCT